MKISCTPISCAKMFHNGTDQDAYFAMIAEAGAEGSDLLSPEGYPWFWQDFENEKKTIRRRLRDRRRRSAPRARPANASRPPHSRHQQNQNQPNPSARLHREPPSPPMIHRPRFRGEGQVRFLDGLVVPGV